MRLSQNIKSEILESVGKMLDQVEASYGSVIVEVKFENGKASLVVRERTMSKSF